LNLSIVRPAVLAAGLLGFAGLLSGCATGLLGSAPAPTVTVTVGRTVTAAPVVATPTAATKLFVTGTLDLMGSDSFTDLGDGTCAGSDGYSDIEIGGEVTIFDAASRVIAAGELDSSTSESGECDFTFSVANVPVGPAFYQVEVTHRGMVTEDAAAVTGNEVALTLGG